MNYWLIKSEPKVFSWADLETKGRAVWDGVRNYAARNHLKAMRKGDLALFYHSNEGLEIVGIAEIIKEHYQDPTTNEKAWVAVDVKPYKKLSGPVSLSVLKNDKVLKEMVFVKIPRLSVSPVSPAEYKRVIEMSAK